MPASSPPRILVIGDVMLDLYTWGTAGRVSPEAPVLVLKAQREEARLGGAGAVASLLAGLGVEPIVVGVVGADGPAQIVQRLVADFARSRAGAAGRGRNSHEFCDAGLSSPSSALFPAGDRPTTVKERLIGQTASRHGQQMLRVDRESCEPLPDLLEDKLCVAALAALDHVQAVLISDYGKGVCSPKLLAGVIRAAANRNLPVLVDPRRGADYAAYRGATLIKPNRHEAGEATGRRILSRGEALAAGRDLCARHEFRAAVITLDADGMVLVTAADAPLLPSEIVQLSAPSGRSRVRQNAGEQRHRARVLANAATGYLPLKSPTISPGEGRGEGGRNPENGHTSPSARATYVESHFATRDREVADVTGAGDTVLAVLGTALARGVDLPRACKLATAAAGLQVERVGVAPISWNELPIPPEIVQLSGPSGRSRVRQNAGEQRRRARVLANAATGCLPLRSWTISLGGGEGGPNPANAQPEPSDPDSSALDVLTVIPTPSAQGASRLRSPLVPQAEPAPPGARILPLDELLPLVGPASRGARVIVFTNGCFDLLHSGHVHCLKAAKALGDVLVVGVNSDASVRRLKGPSRPIVGQGDRAAMLAALACVDYVVIFDDDTPEHLVAELRPDVLVKGSEPRPGPIPGESIVASYGGRLELIPTLPGVSTTALLERLLPPPPPPGEGRGEGGQNPANGRHTMTSPAASAGDAFSGAVPRIHSRSEPVLNTSP